jgi:hypothetical protein
VRASLSITQGPAIRKKSALKAGEAGDEKGMGVEFTGTVAWFGKSGKTIWEATPFNDVKIMQLSQLDFRF